MKKILIISGLVLTLLVVVYVLISRTILKNSVKDPAKNSPTPTSIEGGGVASGVVPTLTLNQKRQEVQRVNSKILTAAQSRRFHSLRSKMPLRTFDFDMAYSSILDQYFVSRKTKNADTKLNEFLQANGILDVKSGFPELFVMTSKPIEIAMPEAEKLFLQKKGRNPDVLGESDTNPEGKNHLYRLMKYLLRIGSSSGGGGSSNTPNPGGGGGGNSSLDALFTEAGNRVGVPAALLKAVMQKECGSLLSETPENIQAWSTPGGGLPETHACYDNHWQAGCCFGPMQFMQTTWEGYAGQVQEMLGHVPNIENIRDSLHAAGLKLKNDGGGGDPNTWTKDQFFQAFRSYYGACGDSYDPHYCETAYQNYLDNIGGGTPDG